MVFAVNGFYSFPRCKYDIQNYENSFQTINKKTCSTKHIFSLVSAKRDPLPNICMNIKLS